MTDNELIKALECCKDVTFGACRKCPLSDKPYRECSQEIKASAFDLIKRQEAEIEIIQRDYECLVTQVKDAYAQIVVLNRKLNTAKTKAIKEFTERLKRKTFDHRFFNSITPIAAVDVKDINNLVKEMTE